MTRTRLILPLAAALCLFAGSAQAMTVREFLATAARIPQNATAAVHPATRQLMEEIRTATTTIRAERTQSARPGARPRYCLPEGKISVTTGTILARFNAIPPARRNISVTQAMREWMADRYPCPPS